MRSQNNVSGVSHDLRLAGARHSFISSKEVLNGSSLDGGPWPKRIASNPITLELPSKPVCYERHRILTQGVSSSHSREPIHLASAHVKRRRDRQDMRILTFTEVGDGKL